jgi:hypothetical protein
MWCILSGACLADPLTGLVGHWKLAGDCRDYSGQSNHGVNHGADLAAADGARFDGIDDFIEVPSTKSLSLGSQDFSIAVWVHTDGELADVLGDILSQYDPASRKGITLSLLNYAGVTSSQSNYRNVFFGIDAGRVDKAWTDCGRPGNARYIMALAVFDGHLYAGTYEEGEKEAGHVYRYDGGTAWIDCGSPDQSNAIGSLAVYKGKLYAGSARYNAEGSALVKSRNWRPGGRVYRFEEGRKWTDCGKLGDANEVVGMAVFQGKLYASPLYQDGKGLYRYEGGRQWTFCGNPGRRIQPLAVYNGALYAGSYDYGRFVRYDGQGQWTDLGQVPDTTQVYSFAVYQGRLHVCTWPTGSVFVYDTRKNQWTNVGRLGNEKEVMGVAVYNGKLYAGTLPLGAVFRYESPNQWTLTGQLDTTPAVTYRRVWSMAVYQGRLFAGTLPSGHVLSLEAGRCVTYDRELAPGWRHITAVKAGGLLKLYVDGQCAARSSPFDPADYDLSIQSPLRIGFGQHDYFSGRMRDLRFYRRAMGDEEIRILATR